MRKPAAVPWEKLPPGIQTIRPGGEYVLVVAGAPEPENAAVSLEDAAAQVLALQRQGVRLKDAAKEVAAHTGLSRNDLYTAALGMKSED